MKPHLQQLALVGLLLSAPQLHAQHSHLNAGAVGTAQNDPLIFTNGAEFAAGSGYVKDLTFAATGQYAGYYQGGLTFTALPQTIANGGPVPNAPAFGSFIQTRIESVSGPAGGHFAFWEEDATAPTLSLSSGTTTPSGLWPLSDAALGAGTPGGDPFGHLHGRRFTVDVPGDYTVSFRLFDTSVNGADNGRIHRPSDPFSISFRAQAVPEPTTLALAGAGVAMLGAMAWRHRRTEVNAKDASRLKTAAGCGD